ncbi:hypothetical protein FEM48_ZijujUnG0108100 [Ziziphus jujuba var. spinosa]|uniref:Protein EXORDIUM-like 2 n=2 Tax=Ziziphus jujuba TaxID=326968 RepID=A0A978U835_ZIZJJ|nr:hypothetical protein FEM48_ZijujUnG0108100 [Ziziphus jujuba var. spinosa]
MILKRSLLFSLIAIIILALASCSHGLKLNQTQKSQPLSLSPTSTILNYHGGPLLTSSSTINVYLVCAGKPVPTSVRIPKQISDIYSLGKNIKRAQISSFVVKKIEKKVLPLDSNGIYLVLTAKDVIVERFCMGSCGFHDSIILSTKSKVVVAHVGDLSLQCPGLCAWPYAVPAYGPPGQALVALNGVGTDGLVTGSASNPFNNGYYQGDALAPLEAVTACPGIFGAGTYPGFPGNLVVDRISKASFNAFGLMAENFFFLRCGIPRA